MPRKKRHRRPKKSRFDADLHMHSTCSDGELSPEQLVEMARKRDLKTISITDHDSVQSYFAASSAAKAAEVHLVPGTEISAFLHREIHVLGLFVEPSHEELGRKLAEQTQARVARVHAICERLAAHNIKLNADAIVADASGNVGRPHIAQALVKGKFVANFHDAFEQYLGRRGRAYVEARRLPAEFAINLIQRAGGVAILAHPGVEKLSSHFHELKAMGLDGIEINHPAHGANVRASLKAQARKMHFLVSGGSDMHNHQSACKLGDLGVNNLEVKELMDRANHHRRKGGLREYSYG